MSGAFGDIQIAKSSRHVFLSEFIDEINNLLENFKNYKNHILVGDSNIDIMGSDLLSREFQNSILGNGSEPCFKDITRTSVDEMSGSCIDNIFIKTKRLSFHAFKLTNTFTDLYPSLISIDSNKMNNEENDINNIMFNYRILKKNAEIFNSEMMLMQDPNIYNNGLSGWRN